MRFSHIITILLLSYKITFSSEYQLFQKGTPHPNYDYIVANLVEGDIIKFSDKSSFIIQGKVQSGNLNFIIDIGSGNVLRIPKGTGEYVNEMGQKFDYRESINWFLKGAKKLEKEGVPIVKVDFNRYRSREYLVSERMNIKYDFDQFTQRIANNPNDAELLKSFEDLKIFVKKTALLTQIQDLHAGNLVYTDKGWKAMDFMNGIKKYRGHSIINYKSFEFLAQMQDFLPLIYAPGLEKCHNRLPLNLRVELNEVVEQERATKSGAWHQISSSCALLLQYFFTRRK